MPPPDSPPPFIPDPGLYLVGTPIGNLRDITLRALDVLRAADVIGCEDTRRAKKILAAYAIPFSGQFIVYAEHTEPRAATAVMQALAENKIVALTTDAGTPGISDPGYRAVTEAIENGFPVTIIPGPDAVTSAFALGAPGGTQFTFLGFMPKKPGRRETVLEPFRHSPRPFIYFDSPQRLLKTLSAIRDLLGDRRACVCREMTKRNEESVRGTISDIIAAFSNRPVKGECTIVINGSDDKRSNA